MNLPAHQGMLGGTHPDGRSPAPENDRALAPEFVLKTTPPRVAKTMLERESLADTWREVCDRTAIAVVAPAGFGKTTLLVQWRRLWLEQGALVAWIGSDRQDDPGRFIQSMLHAVRHASGSPAFDAMIAQHASRDSGNIDAVTQMLAEIAHIATATVLMIDDAERLPESTLAGPLQYLLHNAPANLHVVIGGRTELPLRTWELAAKGLYATVGIDALRLQLGETTQILGKRFGARIGMDHCARLHAATEGWPIGLQLAIAAIEREPDLHTGIAMLSARDGDIQRYFLESLVSRLPPALSDFLTRIAILDHLNDALCGAVTGCDNAGAFLAQLMLDTPILASTVLEDWMRLHPLARDFLLGRFDALPIEEQRELHARASRWFAEREGFHDAARHALAMGDAERAQSYAIRSLWTLATNGKLLEARDWLERISPDAFAHDGDLRLAAAWVLAIGDRNGEAEQIAREVLRNPATRSQQRIVAEQVAASAAACGDRIGHIPGIHAEGADARMFGKPVHASSRANTQALVALHTGNATHLAQKLAAIDEGEESMRLTAAYARTLIGLEHLRNGEPLRAEAAVRPALILAERTWGRRSMIACLYAPVVAAALLERDEAAQAEAMLADRLDVIERTGAPDTILRAYRTLASIAFGEGDERRALEVLESLESLATRRGLPRLAAHACAERVRIHALAGRVETFETCMRALEALTPEFDTPALATFAPHHRLLHCIASTYVCLAKYDADGAGAALEVAASLAQQLRCGREVARIRVLRAVVAGMRNDDAAPALLDEALGLAALNGLRRLFADTHPAARRMSAEQRGEVRPTAPRPPTRSGLLTAKESAILVLLERGLPNKSIAKAMEISDETVKWHMKNLFLKLAAGTRKHAVDRARLLGLLGY